MAKVYIIQRIFPSYRKAFYTELSRRYELKVLHAHNQSGIEQVDASFSQAVGSRLLFRKNSMVFLKVLKVIRKGKPAVVIHESGLGILSMPFTFILCKLMGVKFAIWGHGYNHQIGFDPYKKPEAFYRLLLQKLADAYILYGYKAKEVVARYVNPTKLFVAQNTLDIQEHLELRKRVEANGHTTDENIHLVYLGRLVDGKMVEDLPEIIGLMPDALRNKVVMHIIGDGPSMVGLKKKVTEFNLEKHFNFHGKLTDNESIARVLIKCKALVIPGYLGLAINHGFCFDLPVFSYLQEADGPFHSPEVEYVKEGKTGFLLPGKSPSALTEVLTAYLQNEKLQLEMKKEIQEQLSLLTLSNMADGFESCIEHVLKHD